MIRLGTAPFLEASSRGDKRFSAFHARIRARGGRSIEEIYQAAKKFPQGVTGLDWRAAKGRKPINIADCATLYAKLWDEYLAENPHLGPVLTAASGIQVTFGQQGHQCQAIELWRIRAALLATAPTDARDGVTQPLRA